MADTNPHTEARRWFETVRVALTRQLGRPPMMSDNAFCPDCHRKLAWSMGLYCKRSGWGWNR